MRGSMSQRIIISGGTGYIGFKIIESLLEQGFKITAIVRDSSTKKEVLAPYQSHDSFSTINYTGKIEELIKAFKAPATVLHLASNFMYEHQPKDIDGLVKSNITFGTHILEAMEKNNLSHFVYAGTSWQNFHSDEYNPVCLYAATKQAFENIVDFYCHTANISAVNLKLFDTYGPDDFRPKIFHLLKKVANSGESLDMSPGDQEMNLTHVDDISSAFLRSIEYVKTIGSGAHQKFGVGSQDLISLKSLVKEFQNFLGKPIHINWGARPYREREVMKPHKNYPQLPGWSPKIRIKDGLKDLV